VLRDHVVDADDVDADGHVLDEILARWVDEACAAYLDQCRVLGEMRDREGLVLRSRVGSWPPGARLGRPTSVAVSAMVASVIEPRPIARMIASSAREGAPQAAPPGRVLLWARNFSK